MCTNHDSTHTIGITTVAPDGSATMQQWRICEHVAKNLRAALYTRYGAPVMETAATAEGVRDAAARAKNATGTVHIFNLGEDNGDHGECTR